MFNFNLVLREFFTYIFLFVFSIWVFFHNHSRITRLQEKGGISLTPHYHFHPLHRHLDISQAITAGRSPLRIGSSSWTRTRNLWFSLSTKLISQNEKKADEPWERGWFHLISQTNII